MLDRHSSSLVHPIESNPAAAKVRKEQVFVHSPTPSPTAQALVIVLHSHCRQDAKASFERT